MPAVVLGDLDLVSALGLAGIRSVVLAARGEPVTYSRFVTQVLDRRPGEEPGLTVQRLLRFAATQVRPPVLYYQSDQELLFVSRHREALAGGFRFVVPDAQLVEDLVDKERFHRLAEERGLPTPRALLLRAADEWPSRSLTFPIVVKPTLRDNLDVLDYDGKAQLIRSPAEFPARWRELRTLGVPLVAQEYVQGPEESIESYHAYVDRRGQVVGEFTGRKIRTRPAAFGFSTALTTSASQDVLIAGRRVVQRLHFCGVLKADFKRDPSGRLHLLEVNPRFNLWHHLGAAAGINLPALVHADLTCTVRPRPRVPKAGFTWCQMGGDRRAAAEQGLSLIAWARWMVRTAARAEGRWSDPLPLVRGVVLPKAREVVRELLRPGSLRKLPE